MKAGTIINKVWIGSVNVMKAISNLLSILGNIVFNLINSYRISSCLTKVPFFSSVKSIVMIMTLFMKISSSKSNVIKIQLVAKIEHLRRSSILTIMNITVMNCISILQLNILLKIGSTRWKYKLYFYH